MTGKRHAAGAAVLTAALLVGSTPAAGQQYTPSTVRPALAAVRAYLDNAEDDEAFSGVVLIGIGAEVIFHEAYGLADQDLGVPMRIYHRFRIGSLTKPLTASAVLVAVDRGLLRLDTRICSLLDACLPAWSDVTVEHLLTHTSGIPDHFGDLEAVPVEKTVDELRRVILSLPADAKLDGSPGSEYAYSNFNYVLLGALLEKVGGASWPTLMNRWVFAPLGLGSLAYDDVYAVMAGRVEGYARDDDLRPVKIDYDDHAAYAAGGLLATAGDLFRWMNAVLSGELFSAELIDQSFTPFRGDYGYGWQVRRFFDRPIYNHTGGIDGFSSHLAHYPAQQLTIVVLSNVEDESALLRACDIAARIFDRPGKGGPEMPTLTPRQRCGLEP